VSAWPEFRPGRLLETLSRAGVDFVVIGGIAAVAHGSATLTRDLDICFAPDPANLETLGKVLVELNARLRGVEDDVTFTPDAATLRRIRVLTLDTPDGPLDLLADPAGAPTYARLRRRAEPVDIGGVTVLVASLDDLIAMKRAAGRDKDLLAVEELQVIRRLRRRIKPRPPG
jgi:predicted nucleotidyltransferase